MCVSTIKSNRELKSRSVKPVPYKIHDERRNTQVNTQKRRPSSSISLASESDREADFDSDEQHAMDQNQWVI